MSDCGHFNHVKHVRAKTEGCEECLRDGMTWVHLRVPARGPQCRALSYLQ